MWRICICLAVGLTARLTLHVWRPSPLILGLSLGASFRFRVLEAETAPYGERRTLACHHVAAFVSIASRAGE